MDRADLVTSSHVAQERCLCQLRQRDCCVFLLTGIVSPTSENVHAAACLCQAVSIILEVGLLVHHIKTL